MPKEYALALSNDPAGSPLLHSSDSDQPNVVPTNATCAAFWQFRFCSNLASTRQSLVDAIRSRSSSLHLLARLPKGVTHVVTVFCVRTVSDVSTVFLLQVLFQFTAGVTRRWVGGDNAILTEPTPSHPK